MKASVPSAIALTALLLSSLSLALQLHKDKTESKFDKYLVPAKLTELQYRLDKANIQVISARLPLDRGVMVPFVRKMSDDRKHVFMRAIVSDQDLPPRPEERKKVLYQTGLFAAMAVMGQFDDGEVSLNDITVEFCSIGCEKNYAVFDKGELTFQ
jgi:hypothetical protein